MTEIIISVLLGALVTCCLIIRKQNKLLKWAMPIIDQLYQERHGDGE